MRYTRLQLSRLFLNLAIIFIPDGAFKPFVMMMKSHDDLMVEIDRLKAGMREERL
jgi:hypothetical protein